MKIGEQIHGFEVRSKADVQEVEGVVYELEHLQSKANVIVIENQDQKKAFLAGFKTIPEESTGVFHILEHSVLNGSRKYPDRSTFVNMMKHSMADFINAITYPDHTVYPFCTENEKEFMSLMDMYMDAVFYPNAIKEEEIFKQEGWHFRKTEAGNPEISGVVYNEMKGMYSSLENVLMYELFEALFPYSSYRFVSGGNPDVIPTLSYRKFQETYRTYYRASNCCIVLYGKMDIEEKLKFLDQKYFSHMGKKGWEIKIPLQIPVERKREKEYSREGFGDQGAFAACAYNIGQIQDREKILAAFVLFQALLGENEAPMKKNLLETMGISDIQYYIMDGIGQPYFAIVVKHVKKETARQLGRQIRQEAEKICKQGIGNNTLAAALNRQEFWLRENGGYQPDGITSVLDAATGWVHGISPDRMLEFEHTIASLRKKAENGYFENLLKEIILENQYQAEVLMMPDCMEAETEIENDKESEKPESLTEKDLEKHAEEPETEVKKEGSVTCLKHAIPTKRIAYLSYYFDLSMLQPEQVPYAKLLTDMIGEFGTKRHSLEQLTIEKNMWTGNMNTYLESYTSKRELKKAKLKFVMDISLLEKNLEKGMSMAEELLSDTIFDQPERIKKIVRQKKMEMEKYFVANGNAVAAVRASAHYLMEGILRERYNGISYYHFLKKLLEQFDETYEEVQETLRTLQNEVCKKAPLTIRYAGSDQTFQVFLQRIRNEKLYKEKRSEGTEWYKDDLIPGKAEAFVIPSKVSYAVFGGPGKYTGNNIMLGRILSFDYLWKNVREKGGAYGCGMSIYTNGSWIMSSYRDPNVKETCEIYRNAPQWFRGLKKEERELLNDKIGAFAAYNRISKPFARAKQMDAWYFCEETKQIRSLVRTQILETTVEELKNREKELERYSQEGTLCVLGNREKIEEASEMFDAITVLLE